jgi:hypothetical protein
VWWCLYVNSRIPAWNDSDSSGCVFFLRVAILCALSEFDIYVIRFCQLQSTSCQNKKYQTHSNSFQSMYIYTPLYIFILYQLYTYSPNPFGKNNYTRLHPLTLCPGVGFLWLLHQQSAGEDAGYAGNTWGCRPPKMGSMHEKKTKHLSQLSQTSFCQDFAALSWSFSPMWSISWDQEASMPWFQAENHPFIPPIHDMEKPNTSAWHIFWYMFIYI